MLLNVVPTSFYLVNYSRENMERQTASALNLTIPTKWMAVRVNHIFEDLPPPPSLSHMPAMVISVG